jgi:hypothetical protein
VNYQNGFNMPIIAILCDGKQFYFFKFLGRSLTRSAKAQFFLGRSADGSQDEPIYEMAPGTDPVVFIQRFRRLCESIFYVFLDGYRSGLEAYWNRSLERSQSEGKGRGLTPGWHRAKALPETALEEAKAAWTQRQEGRVEESMRSAESALEVLAKRYVQMLVPLSLAELVIN